MRRIPLMLVVVTGLVTALSGSALAGAVRMVASPPANTSLPTIAGTAREGQTLAASSGAWSGLTPIAYAYQWQQCNAAGSSCRSIGNATSQNYVASQKDVGTTIRVEVTATNADGKSQALSNATGAVAALGNAPANTKQPDPSGTATAGQTIRVSEGNWSGLKPITFTYQWQSCTGSGQSCVDLAGAKASSYLIGASLVGAQLRAIVTATNSAGKATSPSNLTTAVVVAKAGSPVNSTLPAISGKRSVGQTLSASTGVWTGPPVTGFTYRWSRCGSNGNACANVPGATGRTYGVRQADLGMALRVSVTATNKNGSTSARSAAAPIGRAVLVAGFNAKLRAAQEVTRPKGTSALAAGRFTAKVTGKTLRWTLTYSHLTGRPTVALLQKGVRGTNGVAFKALCRGCVQTARGTLTLTASQLDALMRGRAYVNIRTMKNRQGEIRGQISRVS